MNFENIKTNAITMLKNEQNRKQFLRYLVVGFSAFALEYLSFLLFANVVLSKETTLNLFFVSFSAINIAQSISMVFGTVYSYTLNRLWSFGTKGKMLPEIIRFGLLFVFNLIVTNLLLTLLVNIGIPKEFAKLVVQGMMVCWNFVLYKTVIFKTDKA